MSTSSKIFMKSPSIENAQTNNLFVITFRALNQDSSKKIIILCDAAVDGFFLIFDRGHSLPEKT
ncbi:hypothetical protein BpHYR1_016536 [Brachionus plicatilis]|uniref:Uncharacterized protein n=1 Tax=Brachionus plicatilis TaxID=10195 RepID=A0A3M7R7I4_BRAPC|nr:hypothetical protein BpHYR1_016536 [Brachionus plicatilis]